MTEIKLARAPGTETAELSLGSNRENHPPWPLPRAFIYTLGGKCVGMLQLCQQKNYPGQKVKSLSRTTQAPVVITSISNHHPKT